MKVISGDLIAVYEGLFFTEDALLWLRERPRTFGELRARDIGLLQAYTVNHQVSRPGESHPEALAELYVSLSTHTAPIMEPRRTPICQFANSAGARREIRAIQCVALRRWARSFL